MENPIDDLSELNLPTVDFLILADRAEVLNGKLYMMGGGWDRMSISDFEKQQSIGIAVGLRIPWHATNQQHRLVVRIEGDDSTELFNANIGLTAGRPPILRDAQAQRITFAITASFKLPGPGTCTVKTIINDIPDARGSTFFHADLAAAAQTQ